MEQLKADGKAKLSVLTSRPSSPSHAILFVLPSRPHALLLTLTNHQGASE